jgi:hypothetical protein
MYPIGGSYGEAPTAHRPTKVARLFRNDSSPPHSRSLAQPSQVVQRNPDSSQTPPGQSFDWTPNAIRAQSAPPASNVVSLDSRFAPARTSRPERPRSLGSLAATVDSGIPPALARARSTSIASCSLTLPPQRCSRRRGCVVSVWSDETMRNLVPWRGTSPATIARPNRSGQRT